MIIFLSILLVFSVAMWLLLGFGALAANRSIYIALGVPEAIKRRDALRFHSHVYFWVSIVVLGFLIFLW